ncbi:ArsB/NhaD family transporter [Haloplasma contractile]|uniref:Arsenical pump membrane protein n=1 Tax=Haloplasma contractile SSD-17B TaxID=1033810 RepID=U2FGR9_9MOLU|nr:ArsB/NhaD family transporter [Haloplasma contractile]ERJ12045.1 Arsenical pump membrane protein [Haloplasma contractile SSD-17B]
MEQHLLVAIIIFILTYAAIVSEKINRTAVALFGAILMIVFGVIPQESHDKLDAIEVIDFNTIGLLIGMMLIVNILKRTGIFQYIAIKTAKVAKGDPWKIILLFSIITAISSALLDNVTTILLIAPVTFVITDTLKMNPIPFLISEILAANIGGAATLIGDPPNIMIGGATDLGFLDFVLNLSPVILVIFIITIFILKFIYKDSLEVTEENRRKVLEFDETKTISDEKLLIKSGIVLLITIIGFTIHQFVGLESATIALLGGTLLLLISKIEPEEIFLEIEWPTIFFFTGLFILVGALEARGVIDILAEEMLLFTNNDMFWMVIFILWLSAIASAFLDNIPFVATMIPLIQSIQNEWATSNIPELAARDINPLWWALALGACLGGNGTLVGASANVIVGGMIEKNGYKLSFTDYMKIGFPLMLLSVVIATVYLIMFYI